MRGRVALHAARVEALRGEKRDQFVAQRIAPNARADDALAAELAGVEGHVGRRTAGAARVVKTVPKQLAKANDNGWVGGVIGHLNRMKV